MEAIIVYYFCSKSSLIPVPLKYYYNVPHWVYHINNSS